MSYALIFHLDNLLLLQFDRKGWLTRLVVIVLIAAEILVAAINIVVDLYAGID